MSAPGFLPLGIVQHDEFTGREGSVRFREFGQDFRRERERERREPAGAGHLGELYLGADPGSRRLARAARKDSGTSWYRCVTTLAGYDFLTCFWFRRAR